MSADQLQKKRPFFARIVWLGVPVVAGVLVDGASESLKFVARGITNQLKFFLHWSDLRGAPLALGLCIGLLVLATVLLEKFVDPRPWVRNLLLLISLVIVGAFEPWRFVHRERLLQAYEAVQIGEPLADVLKAIDDRPWIQSHDGGVRNPPGSHFYCEQDCWIRLMYDVPSLWSTRFVEIDFDSKQRVCHKGSVL